MPRLGRGANEDIVECSRREPECALGGGVRTADKARRLVDLGVR